MRFAPPSSTAASTTLASLSLAAILVSGCGSDDSTPSRATTHAQPSGAAQGTEPTAPAEARTGEEEPAASAPAGAAARSCVDREAEIEDLRVTGVDCEAGEEVAAIWTGRAACGSPVTESRFACSAGGYRCLGASTERGIAVSCARRGHSIAFVARR